MTILYTRINALRLRQYNSLLIKSGLINLPLPQYKRTIKQEYIYVLFSKSHLNNRYWHVFYHSNNIVVPSTWIRLKDNFKEFNSLEAFYSLTNGVGDLNGN